ncbi:lipase [Nocardia puris]|uniref:Secretory lipase n=1 Tax=Nocardia puris TaxID=208602 RepID=A0A366D284_9NOCA|nr:lipase family protein [Nocardia puris]MBF6215144.1 lipase [Nocardia puris]MBF6369655.1 lipase [Nocardia puris]MBF6462527.1 lipase [Nocardia puris]RBO83619.1 secretory lipase [Nocardia puris]
MVARLAIPRTTLTATGRSEQPFGIGSLLRVALAAAAAAATCLGFAAPAAAVPIYPVPSADAFFATPGDLNAARPGDVLRSRTVAAPGFPGATVWQLLFRSTNSADQPIAAVTTLLVPPGGGNNRPLVSYQPFVNSLGTHCAPSQTLFNGGLQEAPALNLLLARGWAVAVPDHLGPNSAYGAARLGGRITLDGIRAAQRFAPAGLGGSPVGMAGYSGGGMATGFAAAMAPEYAPELNIVGAAQGGVPVNIGKLALEVGSTPSPLFGLGFAAAIGLEREYPGRIDMARNLNPAGRALRDRIANACTTEIIDAGANRSFSDVFTGALDADPVTVRVLHENSLEIYPGVPRVPVYQWHGQSDQVNPWLVRDLAGRYCAAGTPVLLDLLPGADHGTAIAQGSPRAFTYLADRFAGATPPSNC